MKFGINRENIYVKQGRRTKRAALLICVVLFLSACFACLACTLVACDTPDCTYEVIFFDLENSPSGITHYDGDGKPFDMFYYDGVRPAECYMIKAGNTEILVDAGFEVTDDYTASGYKKIANVYRKTVIKQIEKYCTDGVLEYMIVTHGDFDHIAGCAADDGLFDYIYDGNLSIETIIDFDSDLTEYLCQADGNEIFPSGENRLITTRVAERYRTKRDKLVSDKGVKHIPAAEFFKGTDFLQENTFVNAMPTLYLKEYYQTFENGQFSDEINMSRLTNFCYFADDTIVHTEYDAEQQQLKHDNYAFTSSYKNLDANIGQLRSENDRYYYSIPLENGVELRILYNWFYDHFYKHSFNGRDRNNICVCFEVVDKYDNKFVSFGDLGTGEDGVISYYGDTDVLKNVTCFKASHHGSTNNTENSAALYNLMKPEIVVVTGIAQINRDIIDQSDPIYEKLSGTASMKKVFFDNILNANPNTQIYCTEIARKLDLKDDDTTFALIAASFYGNIYVEMYADGPKADCSHKGKVVGYVSSYSEESKRFKFAIRENGSLLSFNETEYWKAIYLLNGQV